MDGRRQRERRSFPRSIIPESTVLLGGNKGSAGFLRSSDAGEVGVPGVGYCKTEWRMLSCRSALRHPSIPVKAYDRGGDFMHNSRINEGRSPFPAELGISPIVYTVVPFNVTEVELITGEPVFHLR